MSYFSIFFLYVVLRSQYPFLFFVSPIFSCCYSVKQSFPFFHYSPTPYLFVQDHFLFSSIPFHAIICEPQIISPPLPFPTFSLSAVSTQGKTHIAYATPLFSCVHVDFRSPDFARTCTVFLTSNVNFSRSRQTNRIILAPIP